MKLILTEPVKKGMEPVIYGYYPVEKPLHLAIDVHSETRMRI